MSKTNDDRAHAEISEANDALSAEIEMGQVVQFPEPWWAFTFVDMLPHQIWTDEAVGRVVILAPIPDYREALAWAKLRVPGQMMLVEVDRI